MDGNIPKDWKPQVTSGIFKDKKRIRYDDTIIETKGGYTIIRGK